MYRCLLGVALLVALTLPVSAQDRLAVLTDISGSVEIARVGSDSYSAAEWGTQLFEGDRIRTGNEARTSLLFSNGNMLSLDANSSLTVSASATEQPALSGPVRELDGDLLAVASDVMLHRAGEGEVAVLGGLRGNGSSGTLLTRFPVNTRILEGHPTFHWDIHDGAEQYRLKIQTAEGSVWSEETSSTELTYPESAPALQPGTTYFWQVEADEMLDTVTSPLASFQVMENAEAAKVRSGINKIDALFEASNRSSEYHYLLGSFYAGQGLLGNAVEAFSWIAEHNPESASAHRILGGLYSEIGLKDDAIRALQRAVSLNERD